MADGASGHPGEKRVYRTFYRDGKQLTRFESRDGSVAELPGAIRYADEQYAILLERVLTDVAVIGEINLHLWRPGREQPTTVAEIPGFLNIAGPVPVAVSPEGDYYRYDMESDKWVRWESERTVSLSRQTSLGMYKKLL